MPHPFDDMPAPRNDADLAHAYAQISRQPLRKERDAQQAQIDAIKAQAQIDSACIDDADKPEDQPIRYRASIKASLGEAIWQAYYLHCRALGDDDAAARIAANVARDNFYASGDLDLDD